jgi:hypothetical protein
LEAGEFCLVVTIICRVASTPELKKRSGVKWSEMRNVAFYVEGRGGGELITNGWGKS